jgi:hypothetical protein
MVNNRGFLLGEETVKIILAVIAIAFLAYFLVSLYYSNASDQNLKLAEASLENLIEQANAGSESVEIYNPKNWIISSFPQKDFEGEEEIPKSCSNLGWKNCVCIYKWKKPSAADAADKEGVCRESAFVTNGTFLERFTVSIFRIITLEATGIPIKDTPMELSIDTENKKIVRSDGETNFGWILK